MYKYRESLFRSVHVEVLETGILYSSLVLASCKCDQVVLSSAKGVAGATTKAARRPNGGTSTWYEGTRSFQH